MTVKNRTEAITQVNTKITPAVTNTVHKDLLNNDILNSVVFRKDIIASETPGGGTVVVDYVDKDLATVVTTTTLSISFTNIENGDVKYLALTKNAANVITFTGATDISIRKNYINTVVTTVQYVVRNKNSVITVESINIDNDTVGAWQTPSYNTGYSAYATNPFRFRILADLRLELNGAFEESGAGSGSIFTLPAGYRPTIEQLVSSTDRSNTYTIENLDFTIGTDGTFVPSADLGANTYIASLNAVIPLS